MSYIQRQKYADTAAQAISKNSSATKFVDQRVSTRVQLKHQQFLDQLNQYEVEQRVIYYNDHQLNIYYAEPTTYFTKVAADIEVINPLH